MISNNNRWDKSGTHWRSMLDLQSKKEMFLFDSSGLMGLQNLIMQDHMKLINKILFRTEKFKQADNTLNLVETKYSRTNF